MCWDAAFFAAHAAAWFAVWMCLRVLRWLRVQHNFGVNGWLCLHGNRFCMWLGCGVTTLLCAVLSKDGCMMAQSA
jgi:hypothetical protein